MLYTEGVNKDTIYSVPKQSLVVLRQTSEIYLVFMRYLPHEKKQKYINAVDLERFVPLSKFKDEIFQLVH